MQKQFYVRADDKVLVCSEIASPQSKKKAEKVVGHHIFVVDRSGSMCGDIDKLKSSIEQVLAVEFAKRGDVLTSLISFSSSGDVTLHWDKVPTSKVCDLSHPYLGKLRSIKATYLTGISQGLNMALGLVKDGHTTGITLFTDGYANDPSASQEIKNLNGFVEKASKVSGLFVNCIGYRDWCDWPRMQSISNSLSGKTVKATSFSTVLEVMGDTQALLAEGTKPAFVIERGGYDYLVAVNSSGQVNLAQGDLSLSGISKNDTPVIFGINVKDSVPKGILKLNKENAWAYGALVNGFSSIGNYRRAKAMLFESGNKTLWDEHRTAITPSALADMTNDMMMWVKARTNDAYTMGKNTIPKYSLFDLADTMESLPAKSIGLGDGFYDNYRKRSESRELGKRLENGTIEPLRAQSKRVGATYIRGLKFNSNDATVQLETSAKIEIQDMNGNTVRELAHVPLDDMREYRSYTLISSGERNVDKFDIEIYSKDAWNEMSKFVHSKKQFKAGMAITINLKDYSLTPNEEFSFNKLTFNILSLQEAMAEVKLLSAMQDKVEKASYSKEQLEELAKTHITPNLYFSPPTHTPYDSKDARTRAIQAGKLDSYVRYKVNFGTVDLMSSEDFRSGNEFLARYYTVTDKDGNEVKKPKLSTYLEGATFTPRTSKGEVTKADLIMKANFDTYVNVKKRLTNKDIVSRLEDATKNQERARRDLNGLVMYIGCTGLIPPEFESQVTRYEPDDFAAKFNVTLGKDEKEGIFFVYKDKFVINVIPETSWYTV